MRDPLREILLPSLIDDRTVPHLAAGTELLGPYRGSGLREVPYLIRTTGRGVVQVTRLLYLLAAEIDGRRDNAELAKRLSAQVGRPVSAANVEYLVSRRLRPLGIVVGKTPFGPDPPRASAILPFRFRRAVVPDRLVVTLAGVLQVLFTPAIVVFVVGALAAFDVWLLVDHGLAEGVRQMVLEPLAFLAVAGLLLASGAFHELGHAAGCRYSGATPGRLGVGLYVAWPVFYSDVTDSYRLGRAGRLRTDLGGVYFNAVFAVAAAGAYLLTGIEALTVFVVVQQVQMAHQFVPFLRLDGYYVVADIAGVPDPFHRVRPVLASLIPRRPVRPEAAELTPRARAVIAAWALSAIPLLGLNLLLLVIHGPPLVAALWTSAPEVAQASVTALRRGDLANGLAAAVRAALLVLPGVGLLALLTRVVLKVGRLLARPIERVADTLQTRRTTAPTAGAAVADLRPEMIDVAAGPRRRVLYVAWVRPGSRNHRAG